MALPSAVLTLLLILAGIVGTIIIGMLVNTLVTFRRARVSRRESEERVVRMQGERMRMRKKEEEEMGRENGRGERGQDGEGVGLGLGIRGVDMVG